MHTQPPFLPQKSQNIFKFLGASSEMNINGFHIELVVRQAPLRCSGHGGQPFGLALGLAAMPD
jgi:hypothetical protein